MVHTDGQPLRYPDGRKVEFAADSSALSSDDAYLFWKVLTGATLYRIPTAALRGEGLAGNDVSAFVQPYGKVGRTDGFWIARGTKILFITWIEDNAIRARDLRHGPAGGLHTVLQDPRLRWPDTFSQARWQPVHDHFAHPGFGIFQAGRAAGLANAVMAGDVGRR